MYILWKLACQFFIFVNKKNKLFIRILSSHTRFAAEISTYLKISQFKVRMFWFWFVSFKEKTWLASFFQPTFLQHQMNEKRWLFYSLAEFSYRHIKKLNIVWSDVQQRHTAELLLYIFEEEGKQINHQEKIIWISYKKTQNRIDYTQEHTQINYKEFWATLKVPQNMWLPCGKCRK